MLVLASAAEPSRLSLADAVAVCTVLCGDCELWAGRRFPGMAAFARRHA